MKTSIAECYKILNLVVGSNKQAVKLRFFDLSRTYHPDVIAAKYNRSATLDDSHKFARILDAYKILMSTDLEKQRLNHEKKPNFSKNFDTKMPEQKSKDNNFYGYGYENYKNRWRNEAESNFWWEKGERRRNKKAKEKEQHKKTTDCKKKCKNCKFKA